MLPAGEAAREWATLLVVLPPPGLLPRQPADPLALPLLPALEGRVGVPAASQSMRNDIFRIGPSKFQRKLLTIAICGSRRRGSGRKLWGRRPRALAQIATVVILPVALGVLAHHPVRHLSSNRPCDSHAISSK